MFVRYNLKICVRSHLKIFVRSHLTIFVRCHLTIFVKYNLTLMCATPVPDSFSHPIPSHVHGRTSEETGWVFPVSEFLAVHNSSIGDLVTHWLTDSLLLLTYKEQPKRLVTFEKFDQSDEETWPEQHFDNFEFFDNFGKFWQF